MAGTPLPDTGVVGYNGVVFDQMLKTHLTGDQKYDRANRQVKFVEWVLTVDGYLLAGNSVGLGGPPGLPSPNISADRSGIDSSWQFVRQRLQQAGGVLIYLRKGFGALQINGTDVGSTAWQSGKVSMPAGGSVFDAQWGPQPKILEFTPLGNALSAKIVWQVVFRIPECSANNTYNELLSFAASTSLSYGDDGYASFSVEGSLEIGMTHSNRNIRNVEAYRAMTDPDPLISFRPTRRERNVSDDRRTMTWSYSYEEIPELGTGGVPTQCMKAGGRYSVKSPNKALLGNTMWTASLNATYTLRGDAPREEAYRRFLALFKLKTEIASSRGKIFDPPNSTKKGQIIVRSFGFNEGLYLDAKSISFEMSWTLMCSLYTLLAGTGIWRRLADANTETWQNSVRDVIGFRNWRDLILGRFGGQDLLVDACSGQTKPPDPNLPLNPNTNPIGSKPGVTDTSSPNEKPGGFFTPIPPIINPPPSGDPPAIAQLPPNVQDRPIGGGRTYGQPGIIGPETSWIDYMLTPIVTLNAGTVRHKLLPQTVLKPDTLASADAYDKNAERLATGVNLVSNAKQNDYVQQAFTPTYTVRLVGRAVRAGYEIPIPGLLTYGGVPVVPGRQQVIGPTLVANYSGIPVYGAIWDLEYIVPTPPNKRQDAPPNLSEHIALPTAVPTSFPLPAIVGTDAIDAADGVTDMPPLLIGVGD